MDYVLCCSDFIFWQGVGLNTWTLRRHSELSKLLHLHKVLPVLVGVKPANVNAVFFPQKFWPCEVYVGWSSPLFQLHEYIQLQFVYGLQKSQQGIKKDWGSVRILFSSLSPAPSLFSLLSLYVCPLSISTNHGLFFVQRHGVMTQSFKSCWLLNEISVERRI